MKTHSIGFVDHFMQAFAIQVIENHIVGIITLINFMKGDDVWVSEF